MSTPAHLFPGASVYAGAVGNWGYPKGAGRRVRPNVLLVVHITDNHNLMDAAHEAAYAATNDHSSWTFCNNRDGSTLQLLDPTTQAPWTNGDGNAPNMNLATIRRIFDGNPYNPNEFCFGTAENVGSEAVGAPITDAQVETLAHEAAWLADLYKATYGVEIPITRETVLGHRDFNSVTRYGCPTRGNLDALLGRIIARANELRDDMNARPATLHPVPGASVSIAGGQRYNAFQFVGMDGTTPVLRRYNDITWAGDTSADVYAFAHWEADKAEADCYMVSPWVFITGVGWRDNVWWSRTPLPPPEYHAPAAADTSGLEAKVASLTSQLQAATTAAASAKQAAADAEAEAARVKAGVTNYLHAEDALRTLGG